MSSTETLDVQFEVIGIEKVAAGSLVGLAIAEVVICGVVVRLQGIQVVKSPAGLVVNAPKFRDGCGTWRSAVVLPEALRDALGAEVLSHFR